MWEASRPEKELDVSGIVTEISEWVAQRDHMHKEQGVLTDQAKIMQRVRNEECDAVC